MRVRTLAILPMLTLVACEPPAEERPPEPPPIATAAELLGEYRVAGIDGSDIDQARAVTATIDDERIEVASDCIRLAWSYTLAEGVLATEQAPAASCRRAYDDTEQAILAALDVADTARRTAADRLEISGGGHSVTLSGR